MQDEVMISVLDLKKKFKVYMDKGNSLKEKMLFWKRNRYEKRLVLQGISFDIRRGEAVGLVGKNGCGKSTTLKLLTRIMYPTSGRIQINGRVSSLIELGAGFHPDMTGRENIYTNASIFGLTKKQIDDRLEDIITFSELEEFIDNPVRTYSSGMYMRLAFSVAINVEADILLIDEILAVGDVSFQKKCFEKLKQIKRNGTTIVIVSHALGQVEEICDRSIWIENGRIRLDDEPKKVHRQYLAQMEKERMERVEAEYEHSSSCEAGVSGEEEINYFCGRKVLRLGEKKILFTDVVLKNKQGMPQAVYHPGDSMYAYFTYRNYGKIKNGIVCARIYNEENLLCFGTNTKLDLAELVPFQDEGVIVIGFEKLPLLKGQYFIDVDILEADGKPQDVLHEAAFFYMEMDSEWTGVTRINTTWKVGNYSNENK